MANQDTLHPIDGGAHTVFLKPLLATKSYINISVGAFSYYSTFASPDQDGILPATSFFEHNVRYNYGRRAARLDIGNYCAIAHGAVFVMADANHALIGPSTYPFPVFGGEWAEVLPLDDVDFPNKGSISVGHDVWIGMEACIMPGVRIGHGAIIGTRALVAKDVPDYTVVGGNPAKIIRMRFDAPEIARLLKLQWWNWPDKDVTACIAALVKGDIMQLEAHAHEHGLLI